MARTSTASRKPRRGPADATDWRLASGFGTEVPDDAFVVHSKQAGWLALWRAARNIKSTETLIGDDGVRRPWSEINSHTLREALARTAFSFGYRSDQPRTAGRFIYHCIQEGKGWHLAWHPTREALADVMRHGDYEHLNELSVIHDLMQALSARMPWPEINRAYSRWIGPHSRTEPILVEYETTPIAELGRWDDRIALKEHDPALLAALWPWVYGTHQKIGLLLGLFDLEYDTLSCTGEPFDLHPIPLTTHGAQRLAEDPAGVLSRLDAQEYLVRPQYSCSGSHLIHAAAISASIPAVLYDDALPALRLVIGEDATTLPFGLISAPSLRLVTERGTVAEVPKPLALPIIPDDLAADSFGNRFRQHDALTARLTGLHPAPICVIAHDPIRHPPRNLSRLPGVHRALLTHASAQHRNTLWVGGPAVVDVVEATRASAATAVRYRFDRVVPSLEQALTTPTESPDAVQRPAFVVVRERTSEAYPARPVRNPADVVALLREPWWPRVPMPGRSSVWILPLRHACLDAAGPLRAAAESYKSNAVKRALQALLLADVTEAVVVEIEDQPVLSDAFIGRQAADALTTLHDVSQTLGCVVQDWIITTEPAIAAGEFVSGRAYLACGGVDPLRSAEAMYRAAKSVRYDQAMPHSMSGRTR